MKVLALIVAGSAAAIIVINWAFHLHRCSQERYALARFDMETGRLLYPIVFVAFPTWQQCRDRCELLNAKRNQERVSAPTSYWDVHDLGPAFWRSFRRRG